MPTSWSRRSRPTSGSRSTTSCRSTSSGFQDAVNALGGIYLNFPYPAKDAYSGLDITTPGCQLLNGAQALAVARARHYEYYENGYWQYDGTSDFGRIQRQDVFLRALITAAKSKVNPLTVNAFIGSIHEGITIDDGFGFNELIGLALDYHSFDPTNLQGADAAHRGGQRLRRPGRRADGATSPQAQQMLVNIFGSSLIAPTNPPPDAERLPQPSAHHHAHRGGTGQLRRDAARSGTGERRPAATTTTTPPPSFNPTTCTPS